MDKQSQHKEINVNRWTLQPYYFTNLSENTELYSVNLDIEMYADKLDNN